MRLRLFTTGGTILLATLMAAAGLVAVTADMASAAVPPFDPAGNGATQGTLSLYDAAGAKVTGGALSTLPAYALANTDNGRAGDTAATLYAATPQEGVNPFLWPTGKISLTSTYPDAGAPGTLHNNPNALAGGIYKWLDPAVSGSYAAGLPERQHHGVVAEPLPVATDNVGCQFSCRLAALLIGHDSDQHRCWDVDSGVPGPVSERTGRYYRREDHGHQEGWFDRDLQGGLHRCNLGRVQVVAWCEGDCG